MRHTFSDQSRRCRDVLPNTQLLATSDNLGWTSLRAVHTQNSGICDVYETRPTPDQLVAVMIRGEMVLESFERGIWRKAVFQAGSAGLTAPGEIDRLRWCLRPNHSSFEKLHLFIPQSLIAETIEHFRRPGQRISAEPFSSLVFRDGALAEVAGALLSAMQEGAPDFYAQTIAQWLSVQLVCTRLNAGGGADNRRPPLITDGRLARALEYMSANLAQDIKLETVAAEAATSKFHFIRLFRECLGMTPIRYLANLRLNMAARLLTTTDLPVSQIASDCGYLNVAYFVNAFRRHYGLSPERYRN